VVDELLNSLSNKFAGVSSEIFAKSKRWIEAGTMFGVEANIRPIVDEMSRRLDNLEATLQSSSEGRDGKSSPVKQ
jgi:heat shock factor-binding protein 1